MPNGNCLIKEALNRGGQRKSWSLTLALLLGPLSQIGDSTHGFSTAASGFRRKYYGLATTSCKGIWLYFISVVVLLLIQILSNRHARVAGEDWALSSYPQDYLTIPPKGETKYDVMVTGERSAYRTRSIHLINKSDPAVVAQRKGSLLNSVSMGANNAAGLECAAKKENHVSDVARCNLNVLTSPPRLLCGRILRHVWQPVLNAQRPAIVQN